MKFKRDYYKMNKHLSKEEKVLVDKESKYVYELCDKSAEEINAWRDKEVIEANSTCPKCGTGEIVDKIANTTGRGSGSCGLFGGYSSLSVRTDAVNHCNKCGHQWHKQESDHTCGSRVLEYELMAIAYCLQGYIDPMSDNVAAHWGVLALSGCSAETIMELIVDRQKEIYWMFADIDNVYKKLLSLFPSIKTK